MDAETTEAYLELYLEGRLYGETPAQARAGADDAIKNADPSDDSGAYSAFKGLSLKDGIASIDDQIRQHPDYDAAQDKLVPKTRSRY